MFEPVIQPAELRLRPNGDTTLAACRCRRRLIGRFGAIQPQSQAPEVEYQTADVCAFCGRVQREPPTAEGARTYAELFYIEDHPRQLPGIDARQHVDALCFRCFIFRYICRGLGACILSRQRFFLLPFLLPWQS